MAVNQLAIAKKIGTTAQEVRSLLLTHHIHVKAVGGFNEELLAGVRAFQMKGVDYTGRPLVVDGIVGKFTLEALRRAQIPSAPLGVAGPVWPPAGLSKAGPLAQATLKVAFDYYGEWLSNLSSHGALRKKFRDFVGISSTQDWCAAFVSRCLDQGKANSQVNEYIPKTAGARSVLNKVAANSSTKSYALRKASNPIPRCGDIIVWWRKSPDKNWEGHIGFVLDFDGVFVHTIEGNAGDAIRYKRYQAPFDYPVNEKGKNPRGFYGIVRYP